MPDEFVSLDVFFRRPAAGETVCAPALAPTVGQEALDDEPSMQARAACGEVIAAARRFRAALADAADASLERLLRTLAHDVLGRELALAPADVRALVSAALERVATEHLVCVRAHPKQTRLLEALGLPVRADARLPCDDFVLQLQSGTIVASLRARLDWALESVAGT